MKWHGLLIGGLLALCGMGAHAADADFTTWLDGMRMEAAKAGISDAVINDAFTDLAPDPDVIRLDRKQPESQITFTQYAANIVSDTRVAKGREMLAENRQLLNQVAHYYHVQPQYIVALWGIETNFGANTGNFSLVDALATLAYEGRRAEFFQKELINALKILQQEHMSSADLTGSWAGAMGNCQFMPSTYLHYAVDWDHDGKRDIWNSLPDSFASIANYLQALNWDDGQRWGYAVTVPEDFSPEEADIKTPKSLDDWIKRGVTVTDGSPLPSGKTQVYVIYPGKPEEGAYLVTGNFQALLQWNRSRYFATSVGMLADRIAGDE